jgi:AcrR family transcriptional regulator
MTHEGSGGPASPGTEANRPRPRPPGQARGGSQPPPAHGPGRQPSHGGGVPARDRELRAQGRATVRRLLEAGMIEFEERGFQGVRVDDVVRRAGISHGTFYLYFSNKEDLFKALLRDALHDMETVAGDFPVVTRDEAGKTVLRRWVRKFFDVYAEHATVLRILSSAEVKLPIDEMADRIADIMFAAFAPAASAAAASR